MEEKIKEGWKKRWRLKGRLETQRIVRTIRHNVSRRQKYIGEEVDEDYEGYKLNYCDASLVHVRMISTQ